MKRLILALAALIVGVAAVWSQTVITPNNSSGGAVLPALRCDGTTDDAPTLQGAINNLPAGGGTIMLPATLCAIGSTIALKNGVKLIGTGGTQFIHSIGSRPASSGLTWIGAAGGTMVSIETPPSTQKYSGVQINDLSLYGNGIAGTCLSVKSITRGRIDGLYIENCTTVGMNMSVTNPSAGDPLSSNCRNIFSRLTIIQGATGAGIGLRLTGDSAVASNTCLNGFASLYVSMKDSVGIFCDLCDHNTFFYAEVFHAAGGIADAIFLGSQDSTHYAQGNQFFMLTVSGKDASGGNIRSTGFAKGNTITFSDAYTPSPVPIIEGSSTLIWQYENQAFFRRDAIFQSGRWYVADQVADVQAAGTAVGANTIVCTLGVIPRTVTVSDLGGLVTTTAGGGGLAQFAIYTNDPATNVPATFIVATGSVSTVVAAPAVASATLTANTRIGLGTLTGPIMWFCSNNSDAAVAYQSIGALGMLPQTLKGSTAISGLLGANSFRYLKCAGANCQGGSSTFGTWPATLTTSTWGSGIGADGKGPIIAFLVASDP